MDDKSLNKAKPTRPKKTTSLEEKVRQHLTDKNDVITDEDLKEVVVGVDAMTPENMEPKIEEKDIPPSKNITPWDVKSDED